jgi:hypothetical protein
MVNTAGKARWCGQTIDDGAASGQGFQASLMQAKPTKRMSGAGSENSPAGQGHPHWAKTAAFHHHVPAIIRIWQGVAASFQRHGMGGTGKPCPADQSASILMGFDDARLIP